MLRHAIIQSLAASVVEALLLFVPAGTLAWPQGWALLVLLNLCNAAFGIWLMRIDPALLRERTTSPFGAGQKGRDRLMIMAAIALFFGAWFVVMALDARRFGWSSTPVWVQVVGAAFIVGAYVGWAAVMKANSFAAPTIRVQSERNQTVVSTGPYAVVRHPMYAYVVLLLIGAPLMLGSLWGLLGGLVALPLLAARTYSEEALLMDGLPGYRAYAAKVRYRLVPGVWWGMRRGIRVSCLVRRAGRDIFDAHRARSLYRDL